MSEIMEKPTPQEAAALLDNLIGKIPMTRDDHVRAQLALQVLVALIPKPSSGEED